MTTARLTQYPSCAEDALEFPSAGAIWKRIAGTIDTWRERSRSRWHLAHIDKHTLRDAGISQAAVFIEVNKSFWEE